MIDHTGVNVSNLTRSAAFYRAALAALRYEVRKEERDVVIFGSTVRTPGEDPAGDFYIALDEPLTPRLSLILMDTTSRLCVTCLRVSLVLLYATDYVRATAAMSMILA